MTDENPYSPPEDIERTARAKQTKVGIRTKDKIGIASVIFVGAALAGIDYNVRVPTLGGAFLFFGPALTFFIAVVWAYVAQTRATNTDVGMRTLKAIGLGLLLTPVCYVALATTCTVVTGTAGVGVELHVGPTSKSDAEYAVLSLIGGAITFCLLALIATIAATAIFSLFRKSDNAAEPPVSNSDAP